MYLSVIVPCYNEENNVQPFFETAKSAFADIITDTEFIFVNDGSRDKTFDRLKEIASDPTYNVKVISFSRNFGKEAALLAGFEAASGEYTSIIDADLQQNPKYILQMLDIIKEDPDLDGVAAYQDRRNESKLLSFFKNCFYKIINKISDVEFFRSASDFRVLNRKMVDAILALPEKCRFSKGIFSWIGFNVRYMPYEAEDRKSGSSKWNFWSLSAYAIDGIVAFSNKPLILSSVMGVIMCVISIIVMLVTVVKTLIFGDPVAGYPTLASLILLLAGIELFCLGISGQYISKIYSESKNRPVYIIKDKIDSKNEK